MGDGPPQVSISIELVHAALFLTLTCHHHAKVVLPALTLTVSNAWRCVEYDEGKLRVLLVDHNQPCEVRLASVHNSGLVALP